MAIFVFKYKNSKIYMKEMIKMYIKCEKIKELAKKIEKETLNDCEVKDGVDIGPYVHLRPNTVIGNKVHIGNFVEVKNSNVGEGTKFPHLSYIGDSDVDIMTAKNCNMPCASVLWGFRDKKFLTEHGATFFVEKPFQLLPD